MKARDLQFRELISDEEKRLAQNLVYKVFLSEQNWRPLENNPSGIHVEEIKSLPCLCDRYDPVATWHGAFAGQKLAACFRVSSKVDGKFEVERYYPLAAHLIHNKNAREVTRLAIEGSYRGNNTFFQFMRYLAVLSQEREWLIFASVGTTKMAKTLSKLGVHRCDGLRFRYNGVDPNECEIFYFSASEATAVVEKCDRLLTARASLKSRIRQK